MYTPRKHDKMKRDTDEWDLVYKILYRGLFPGSGEIEFFDYDELLLDMDSLLSILLTYDISEYNSDRRLEIAQTLVNNMVYFLEKYIGECNIKIYYNLDEYKKFPSIYPNWCKDRMNRYKYAVTIKFIKKYLIDKLRKVQEIKHNFMIIECEDSPILKIFEDIELASAKNTLILSRDPHYMCILCYHDVSIYNGRFIVNRDTYIHESEYPKVHYTLIPAYYMIAGMKRNEYEGIKLYGPKKTEKLINDNKVAIIKGTLPEIQEVLPYKNIFYLKDI